MRAILVGYGCNNACLFCAQGDLRSVRPSIDEAEIARAIDAIQPGDAVAFVGGEPTVAAALPAWIRAATARGAARVVLQTNGRRLAYRAFANELRKASAVLWLDVSLHGSTAVMHDWHTGVEGSFGHTVQGLRNARAERIPAGVTTVITRSNYRHLVEIARVAHAAGATALHLAVVEPLGRAAARRSLLVPPPELLAPHVQRAAAEASRLGLEVEVGMEVGARTSRRTSGAAFAGIGDVETPAQAADRVEKDDRS